jgi:hypothetical protein
MNKIIMAAFILAFANAQQKTTCYKGGCSGQLCSNDYIFENGFEYNHCC